MSKRFDISSVLVIGAGPIIIGQACEFDYSGTQACKALREEGLRVILINSNPATVMTDPETADVTYIEPVTPDVIETIIAKERPDALLGTMGGQTALNCGLDLWRRGVLDKYNVKMIGAIPEAIEKAENRQLFNEAMERIGLSVPSNTIVSSMKEAFEAIERIGFPAVIRPSFTLGGRGGGIAKNMKEFREIVNYGLEISPTHQVLVDESILGWKEYEMEVIRDRKDNVIIVCSIENIDPMGIHTGDSVTVVPALTLTDKEYQVMRNAAIAVLREIGVEGGSNVQFAVNPKNGKLLVIEMNPRVSRSSALVSKATGYPIAKVAAKLALGYTLDEISFQTPQPDSKQRAKTNNLGLGQDLYRKIPASFEPSIDYVVTKIPRFDFEKFIDTKPTLSTSMRSVGEVMSIGRNFAESLHKGLLSIENSLSGLGTPQITRTGNSKEVQCNNKNGRGNGSYDVNGSDVVRGNADKKSLLLEALKQLRPDILLVVAEAMREGMSQQEIFEATAIDPWFLEQIKKIIDYEHKILSCGLPQSQEEWLRCKKLGFSDRRLSQLAQLTEETVRKTRQEMGIRPVYKNVDACASEFESWTSSFYSCYEGHRSGQAECESQVSSYKKVIILGSGPNRIGQGIEFDYACVHAAQSLSEMGYETIMVNCNPETVSTDDDTSDKLYFEPLSCEHVLEIIHCEQQKGELMGVIVQLGGQTPLKLAQSLKNAGVPILGTSPDSIDLAENRESFQKLLLDLDLRQPANSICYKIEDIASTIEQGLGYPVVVRPSNVLGGRAMAILKDSSDLNQYLHQHLHALMDGPILIDRFLSDAIEIDVDGICDGENVFIAGILEHIERAGIHSGDSACILPPISLSEEILDEIKRSSVCLAKAIRVVGLFNVQYALKDGKLYVIEVNPRASRTTPFVAKARDIPLVKIASQVMVGKRLSEFNLPQRPFDNYYVKEVALPFVRFPYADTLLGPEMKSTGEAMGWAPQVEVAFAKAQLSVSNGLPDLQSLGLSSSQGPSLSLDSPTHNGGPPSSVVAPPPVAVVAYDVQDGERAFSTALQLKELGFEVAFTGGLEELVQGREWGCNLNSLLDREKKSLREFIQSKRVGFAVCTSSSADLRELRRHLVNNQTTYFSTHEAAVMALKALPYSAPRSLDVRPLQSRSLNTL